MAYERSVTCKCDRCGAVVKTGNGDEDDWRDDSDPPAFTLAFRSGADEVKIRFDDLCTKCEKRLSGLVTEATTAKKRGKGSKAKTEPELPLEPPK